MIEEALSARIDAMTGVHSYPLRAPEKAATPFIVYSRVSTVPANSLGRTATGEQVRFQIDVYAETYAAAKALAASIRTALEGHFDDAAGWLATSLENSVEMIDTSMEPTLYRVSADYLLFVRLN